MQCAAIIDGRNKEIFIRNLPAAVKDFVNGYNQLRANILALGDIVQNNTSNLRRTDAQASIANDQAILSGQNIIINTDMAHASLEDQKDKLQQMEANMDQMAKEVPEKTAVIAYPSSEFWGGQQVWVCTGVPQQ
jgi:hypothetical protein